MATAAKHAITLQSSSALAVSSTVTSSTWTMLTALGGLLQLRITNGSSAPTIGAIATVNVSVDGSTWRKLISFTGGITASMAYDFVPEVPPATMYLQVVFTLGAATNGVTVEAYGHELTSIQ